MVHNTSVEHNDVARRGDETDDVAHDVVAEQSAANTTNQRRDKEHNTLALPDEGKDISASAERRSNNGVAHHIHCRCVHGCNSRSMGSLPEEDRCHRFW